MRKIILSAFLCSAIALFGGEPKINLLEDEATFLTYAGPDWEKVAEGVYEKSTDKRTQRVGFGLPAFEFFLERAYQEEDAFWVRTSDQPATEKTTKELEGIMAKIKFLEEGVAAGYLEQERERERRLKDNRFPWPVTYDTGTGCDGNYELSATIFMNLAGGFAEPYGNFTSTNTTATKHIQVYARATNYAHNPPRVDYDHASDSGIGTCCLSAQTSRVEAFPTWQCDITSSSMLYITSGCYLSRIVEDNKSC